MAGVKEEKQMEEIDANEDDGLKLTENITRTNKNLLVTVS